MASLVLLPDFIEDRFGPFMNYPLYTFLQKFVKIEPYARQEIYYNQR